MRNAKTLLTIPGVLLALMGCSEKYEMKHFSPQDGSFTISVPAALEYKSKSVDNTEGISTAHSYSVIFDDVVYGVNTLVLPEQAKEDEKHPVKRELMLKAGTNGMLISNGWKLLREVGDKIDLSPSQSLYGQKIIASTSGSSHTATVRTFVRNGRVYQVMTVVPNKPSYNQDVYSTKFLESFKLES